MLCSRLVELKPAWHRRQVADIAVDDAEERANGLSVGLDRIEIAHGNRLICNVLRAQPRPFRWPDEVPIWVELQ